MKDIAFIALFCFVFVGGSTWLAMWLNYGRVLPVYRRCNRCKRSATNLFRGECPDCWRVLRRYLDGVL